MCRDVLWESLSILRNNHQLTLTIILLAEKFCKTAYDERVRKKGLRKINGEQTSSSATPPSATAPSFGFSFLGKHLDSVNLVVSDDYDFIHRIHIIKTNETKPSEEEYVNYNRQLILFYCN